MSHGGIDNAKTQQSSTLLLFLHCRSRRGAEAIGLYADNGHGGGEVDWPIGPKGNGIRRWMDWVSSRTIMVFTSHSSSRWATNPLSSWKARLDWISINQKKEDVVMAIAVFLISPLPRTQGTHFFRIITANGKDKIKYEHHALLSTITTRKHRQRDTEMGSLSRCSYKCNRTECPNPNIPRLKPVPNEHGIPCRWVNRRGNFKHY